MNEKSHQASGLEEERKRNRLRSVIHHTIIQHIIENGHPPTCDGLSEILKLEKEKVEDGMKDLQEYHGVVLHPNSSEVFVIHPFACFPTNFYIHKLGDEKSGWFSNCAWCSLGACFLIKGDVVIRTSVGGRNCKNLSIHIKNGTVCDINNEGISDLLIHFPIKMKKAWDNVAYTCSNMLFFETEDQIEEWCVRQNMKKGSVQKLSEFNEFAKHWYGNHLRKEDWKKWTSEQAKEIFQKYGLVDPIWDLSSSSSEERF